MQDHVHHAHKITLEVNEEWRLAEGAPTLDPALRWAISLIENEDWDQLARRTGIQRGRGEVQYLPLLAELSGAARRSEARAGLAQRPDPRHPQQP
jgi:hypothetical protein